jgi:hypothetical protein
MTAKKSARLKPLAVADLLKHYSRQTPVAWRLLDVVNTHPVFHLYADDCRQGIYMVMMSDHVYYYQDNPTPISGAAA